MSRLDQQIADNLASYNEGVERIRNLQEEVPGLGVHVDVNEQTKRQALRELYQHHLARYQRLAAEKRAEVETNLRKAKQALFKYRSAISDSIEIDMSMRDAEDRIRNLTDPSEIRARMDDAYELGDVVMSRALLRRSVALGSDFGGADLVRHYLTLYPNMAESYSRLEDASLEAERLMQFGVPGTPMNPEDASRTFKSGGGGLLPDSLVTTHEVPPDEI